MSTTPEEQTGDPKSLVFTDGIPGFPTLRRFTLSDLAGTGVFQELRSRDDPDFSMIVCVPWLFFPDYAPELTEEEQDELQIFDPEQAILFCPVTVDLEADGGRIFVNLLGPFVVNAETLRGRQLVLTDSGYPVRAELDLSAA
jgi:flagellar assembly factor FliW